MNTLSDMNQSKIQSIYELLLWFVIVDGEYEVPEEEVILEFLVENFWLINKWELSLSNTIKKLAEEEWNFEDNAASLKLIASRDELKTILLQISDIMFADWEFEDKEYELFMKLMIFWGFSKEDLKNLA